LTVTEAEEARNKIKDLKLEIIVKRRKELDIRHSEEVTIPPPTSYP
jgi:hypothetical protein